MASSLYFRFSDDTEPHDKEETEKIGEEIYDALKEQGMSTMKAMKLVQDLYSLGHKAGMGDGIKLAKIAKS